VVSQRGSDRGEETEGKRQRGRDVEERHTVVVNNHDQSKINFPGLFLWDRPLGLIT
jgi:hypothetical protein